MIDMHQQFELVTSIGGFDQEEAAAKGIVILESRNDLQLSLALSEQSRAVKRLVSTMIDSIHAPELRDQFGRNMLLEEAFANQMIHGNQGDPTLQSTVVLTVQRETSVTSSSVSCILRLDDHSPPFSIQDVPDPTDTDNLERSTGRGLKLMRELGHATITQVQLGNEGKTMIYTWQEQSRTLPSAS